MLSSADALRRWLGTFCLAMAAGMLIWGQTLLKPHLNGTLFLVYWGVCFTFTVGAILIALLDIRAVRRRTRREHEDLVRRTLQGVEPAKTQQQTSDSEK
jgi:hypothetical protein